MKILLLDNYDSFTFNLLHYIESVSEAEVVVKRNDAIDLDYIKNFDKIMISPGPGLPKQAGFTMDVIKQFCESKSILGVCLGQQAIAEAFGGKLINLKKVFHGVATKIKIIKKDKLFENMPTEFNVGRYHSWIVSNENFPNELDILAVDENDNIMALRHKTLDIRGVQFHPESILTEYGKQIIKNWLE